MTFEKQSISRGTLFHNRREIVKRQGRAVGGRGETDRQTDRQTGRQRQRDRQADKHTDRQRHRGETDREGGETD